MSKIKESSKNNCIQFENKISVLISVYIKERPEYLDKALNSVFSQSRKPDEIVLVEDGILSEELYSIIEKYKIIFESDGFTEFKTVKLKDNMGLGKALNIGLMNCSHNLVARMDSDDIASVERLKIQESFMNDNGDISACGGSIAEFYKEEKVSRIKSMPLEHDAIYKYARYRNPLNHMTVMFRKKDVLEVGNYLHIKGLEDYYLWSRLLAAGKRLGNIDEVLVYARIDRDFSGRRGGYNYFKQYCILRRLQYKLGLLKLPEYIKAWILSFAITMQPKFIRKLAYELFLRKNI